MQHPPATIKRMWQSSFMLSALILVVSLVYSLLYYGSWALLSLNQAVGVTAALMIGISYAMSGMAYYFDFLDEKVAYRKYYGLVGLLFAFAYAYGLFFLDPDRYFYGFFSNLGSADFILGILAMIILAGMVVISTPQGIRAIGAQNWRLGLRAGYLASALFVARAVVVWGGEWKTWVHQGYWFFPPSMLVATVFTVVVILFRGSIFVARELRKASKST